MKHLYSMLLLAGIATLFSLQSVAQTTMRDMEYYGHHIYLKSDFSGKAANFVIDTGADMVYG